MQHIVLYFLKIFFKNQHKALIANKLLGIKKFEKILEEKGNTSEQGQHYPKQVPAFDH